MLHQEWLETEIIYIISKIYIICTIIMCKGDLFIIIQAIQIITVLNLIQRMEKKYKNV